MQISIAEESGVVPITVLHLTGDLASEEPLETVAREAFDRGARNMVIDLSGVPYISSAGLRALHVVYMMLRDADPSDGEDAAKGIARGTYKSPHLKLLKPSKNATKALGVAGYDMFLETFDNYQKAVDSFS